MDRAGPGAEDLPDALRLAWWGTSWLRGHLVADALIDGVLGPDATHLLAFADGAVEPVAAGLARLRSAGAAALGAAFPIEGDPVGLGGPAAFNVAALSTGQAVLVLGAGEGAERGLVPERVGAAVTWRVMPAAPRQVPDVGEADRALRAALIAGADALAALDVARWRPEVADELADLRRRPSLPAPDGIPHRCVELAARALRAVRVVELARDDHGGALTAHAMDARSRALVPLERAAHRALTAAASPEVWPPA